MATHQHPTPPNLVCTQIEGFLEELLLLCQRSEEYTQFLLARMGEVAAPAPLPPARETALRGGPFNSAVRGGHTEWLARMGW